MSGTDTTQQKAILRTSLASRTTRRLFPVGSRVEGAPGVFGTVVRHIPSTNAQGGSLRVQWDSGTVGLAQPASLTRKD